MEKAGATVQKKPDLLKTVSQVQRALSGLSREQKAFVLSTAKGALDLEAAMVAMPVDVLQSPSEPQV